MPSDSTQPLADLDESASRPRDNAMLVLQRGADAGRRWPLERTKSLIIGRGETCEIHLPDL